MKTQECEVMNQLLHNIIQSMAVSQLLHPKYYGFIIGFNNHESQNKR